MTAPEEIHIRTKRAGPGVIEIVWRNSTGDYFPPYRLFSKSISAKVVNTRQALEQLRLAYLQPNPDFAVAVRALSDRGHELRLGLFDDCLPEDRSIAFESLCWFRDVSQGPVLVTVHADPILPVPWGLLHERGEANDASSYDGFWAVRHQVATLYNGMRPQQLRTPRPAQNVKLLSGLNQEVFEGTVQRLDQAPQRFIANFLDRAVGQAFTIRGCVQRWKEVGDSDCVIHFFGHATGSELRFSETDVLTASDFRTLFRRESRVVHAVGFKSGLCAKLLKWLCVSFW